MSVTTMDGAPLSTLGLSGNPEMDAGCVPAAAEAGINSFFFYDNTSINLIEGLLPLLQAQRSRLFVATGSESRECRTLERYLDEACLRLGVDVIDLFLAEYVNPKDDIDEVLGHGGVLDLLNDWKRQGRIRYAGALRTTVTWPSNSSTAARSTCSCTATTWPTGSLRSGSCPRLNAPACPSSGSLRRVGAP